MQHENVARLVGLCLSSSDPKSTSEKWDQILILNEYCSRGSLRDVLLNVHIHLDWPFRLSLISDIASVREAFSVFSPQQERHARVFLALLDN